MEINEYDKILLSILTLILGGFFAMLMRHASKLAAHQRSLDTVTGKLDLLPSSTELVVRRIIEEHEHREDAKFESLHEKVEEVRVAVAGLKKL